MSKWMSHWQTKSLRRSPAYDKAVKRMMAGKKWKENQIYLLKKERAIAARMSARSMGEREDVAVDLIPRKETLTNP